MLAKKTKEFPGLKLLGESFLHDNARPHIAKDIKVLKSLDLDIVEHQTYSPDLFPTDFHLFLSMEHYQGGDLSQTWKK